MPEKTYILFDTETTGVPESYNDHPKYWPRLVQLAYVVVNGDGRIFKTVNRIVKPEGFIIGEAVTRIHKISHQRALDEGYDLLKVMTEFGKDWKGVDLMVCHNVNFDLNIVSGEAFRLWGKTIFEMKPSFCTMEGTKRIVNAKDKLKRLKRPSLQDLHKFCFGGVGFDGAHDALVDVMATYRCFEHLKIKGLIEGVK